jgi:cobalt-zinc-cadmium efflux system outer membrane protein
MMRVEIEAERAMSDFKKSQLDEKRASFTLAQTLGIAQSPGQTINLATDWPLIDTQALEQSKSLEFWLSARPDVQAFHLRTQAAQALLENAKALAKIDPTIGLSVDSNPGTSKRLTELRVQFPLQISSTYDGEIGRATAQYFQAQTQYEQAKLNAEAEWLGMREAYSAAMVRHKIYSLEILPRAQKVATQAELAYAKGAIPLVDLLDARRTLKASLIEALDVQSEYAKTYTALQLRAPKL